MKTLILVAIAFLTGSVQAEVFKCVNGGKTTYQETPCANDAKQTQVVVEPRASSGRKAFDEKFGSVFSKIDTEMKYVPPGIGASELDLVSGLESFRTHGGVQTSETTDAQGTLRLYRITDYAKTKTWRVYVKNGVVVRVSQQ